MRASIRHSNSTSLQTLFIALGLAVGTCFSTGRLFGQGPTSAVQTLVATPSTQPSGLGLVGYKVKPAYEKAVAQFEAVPTTRPTKVGGTVFIGSSSFTKWKTLEQDLAAFNAINCGFGGSRTDDVLYYGERILKPLRPSRIVYYCGGNDVASKRSAEIVFENFKSFVALARQDFPAVPIYFISQNIVPKRVQFAAQCTRLNQDVEKWAATVSGVYFINAQPGLLDSAGSPRAEFYVKDGVHLNADGYKIWQANIAQALAAGSPVVKVKTATLANPTRPY